MSGGIDAVVLNASALALMGTLDLPTKRYELMSDIIQRGTFLMGKACLPHLIQAENPHILAISPPLDFAEHWWGDHLGWTMTKYAMSLCVRGWSQEFKAQGVAANGSSGAAMPVLHDVGLAKARTSIASRLSLCDGESKR